MSSRSKDVKTGLVRAAFVDSLFKPQADDFGKNWWTCTLLIPKSEPLTLYEGLILEAGTAEWGDKFKSLRQNKLIHNPILDGDGPQGCHKKTGERYAGFANSWFIRVKSGEAYRPALIDRQKLPIVDREKLYSGCYGYAVINCFTWENEKKGKGLTFGISMFQSAEKGERLGGGGGVDVDKWAEVIPDEGEAPAAVKTGAGAGGLFG
jgi:hypothetical protein